MRETKRVKGEGHCTVGCFVARCNSFCSCTLLFPSIMTVQVLGGAPSLIHVRCVGLNLGGNAVVDEGFSAQGQAGCWGKACFSQQLSGKVHVETRAGGCQSLNLGISQDQEIGRRCAVVGFPPRTPCVTPVLPGVWFFQNAAGMWERWVLPLLTGAVDWVWKGSYRTAWAVPCGSSCSCSFSYGRGGLSGRTLESGVGHC